MDERSRTVNRNVILRMLFLLSPMLLIVCLAASIQGDWIVAAPTGVAALASFAAGRNARTPEQLRAEGLLEGPPPTRRRRLAIVASSGALVCVVSFLIGGGALLVSAAIFTAGVLLFTAIRP